MAETNVALKRTANRYDGLPCYTVAVEGEVVGLVFRKQTTWERRTGQRRYVNARGTTTRYWGIEGTDGVWIRSAYDTRGDAVAALLARIDRKGTS